MLIKYRKSFKKDVKRLKRRGKDLGKLKHIIEIIAANNPLPKNYLDHPLSGNYSKHHECHIEPDWLLIYKIDHSQKILFLEHTGSHSDLFK